MATDLSSPLRLNEQTDLTKAVEAAFALTPKRDGVRVAAKDVLRRLLDTTRDGAVPTRSKRES